MTDIHAMTGWYILLVLALAGVSFVLHVTASTIRMANGGFGWTRPTPAWYAYDYCRRGAVLLAFVAALLLFLIPIAVMMVVSTVQFIEFVAREF